MRLVRGEVSLEEGKNGQQASKTAMSSRGGGERHMPEASSARFNSRIILRVFEGGVDILRETTEIKTGRISLESLGWADLRSARVPEQVLPGLASDEASAVQVRLQLLRDNVERRDRADAFMLHADINRIRNWALSASQRDIENIADDLMYEMQELRKLLMTRLTSFR